ncbi:hemolymph lipopolysaccharide-binding protein-like isoform X1 [Neodiprion fabricii]|uniref:hemolymph lipopolysaccharide-binding protein-like isoform X1 n=1 Tax=Neodiprion fabricii TaxID=2872261 RepID=UPI001ED96805|nr:hemolymph lipopolysaccharide-binding protein-like isoform X1 [Neodiprion fabricii]
MSGLLVALPLQLACQLYSNGNLSYGNNSFDYTSAPNQPTVLPAGYTAFPDVGVAYKLHKNQVTWNTARKLCVADGGNLAVIDSFKKNDYVASMKGLGSHVGIHRLFDNVEWVSVKTGQPLNFIPWRPDLGSGQCGAIFSDGKGVGPWNCNSVIPVLCEIPMFTNRDNEIEISQKQMVALVRNN